MTADQIATCREVFKTCSDEMQKINGFLDPKVWYYVERIQANVQLATLSLACVETKNVLLEKLQ